MSGWLYGGLLTTLGGSWSNWPRTGVAEVLLEGFTTSSGTGGGLYCCSAKFGVFAANWVPGGTMVACEGQLEKIIG